MVLKYGELSVFPVSFLTTHQGVLSMGQVMSLPFSNKNGNIPLTLAHYQKYLLLIFRFCNLRQSKTGA